MRNDLAGLGIIDHDENIHCDFFLEFLEAIFIAAQGHSLYSMKSGRGSLKIADFLQFTSHFPKQTIYPRVFHSGKRISEHI